MPLLAIFFLSGISGLIYQVVWVREFGNIFGNTVYSVSLVTGVFMLGLGTGSWLGGRLADVHFSRDQRWPLYAYAIAELIIAVAAAAVAFLLPNLASLSASTSSYTKDANGWFHLTAGAPIVQYAIAAALLTPITILMGATLTLLIRYLIRSTTRAGERIALLYGANTCGAAFGCLLVDFLLIPSFGLFATQLIAVCLNLAAGLGALVFARRDRSSGALELGAVASRIDRTMALTAAALAASGLASMGMEILWFRQLSAALRAQRNVFSLLLATILIGTALGTFAVPVLLRRWRPHVAFGAMMAAWIAAALLGFALMGNADLVGADREIRATLSSRSSFEWWFAEQLAILTPFVQAVLLPVLLIGTTYPLANAHVQRQLGEVGRRAGLLYFANTTGAVVGSLLAGFVLLPWLGAQLGAAVLMGFALLSIVLLIPTARFERSLVVPPLVAALCIGAYLTLPQDRSAQLLIPERLSHWETIATREGVTSSMVVAQSGRERRLLSNGFSMSGTRPLAQRYMRLFVHFPLLQIETPKRVLVVCFGVGNTAHAAIQHPGVVADLVDLDEDVLRLAPYFEATNGGVLQDPRVNVFVNDGRQHLRMTAEATYDLITSEPPPLTNAGVSSLYTVEYYQLARSRLKPGGWMTQWLPIYQVTEEVALSAIRSFLEVFPAAVILSGAEHELILAGVAADRLEIDPERMARLLAARPDVARDLEAVFASSPADLVGSIVAPASRLHRATEQILPMTDDWPIMEYDLVLFAPRSRRPAALLDPLALAESCPRCDLDALRGYLTVQAAYFGSDAFLEPLPPSDPDLRAARRPMIIAPSEETRRALEESSYLRLLVQRRGALPGAK